MSLGVAILVISLVLFRGPLLRAALQLAVPPILGYGLRLDDVLFESSHAALVGVRITRKGEPVLDAARVDLEYHLRDLFPGGVRKFGFVAASIAHPTLYLIRHRDGSFNVTGGAGPGQSSIPSATRAQARPYYFTIRMRDGVLVYRDVASVVPDEREQIVDGVTLDASVKTDSRSSYRFAGVLHGKPVQGAADRAYPLRIDGAIDYDRGFAIHHVRASALPLRTPLASVLHTRAVRVDAGELRDLDLRVFAVGIAVDKPFRYRAGGSAQLVDGRLAVGALAIPVRALAGPLTLYDDGIATRGVRGTVAGVPVLAQGGLFNFAQPTFRIALSGAGDLHDLRQAFGFAARQPLRGTVRLATILENRIDEPLILVHFTAPHLAYGTVPFENAAGDVSYYDSAVSLAPIAAHYGAANLRVAGRLVLGDATHPLDTKIVLVADAPARGIPYAAELVPEIGDVRVAALLSGRGEAFRLGGSVAGAGNGANLSGLFAVDERGYGSYGPIAIDRPGELLVGGLRLDRRAGYDGAWLSARNVRIGHGSADARFPGATIPQFPAVAGVVDGEVAAAGTPDDFGLAGNLHVTDLAVAGIHGDRASARIAGSLANLRLEDVRFASSLGTFAGRGAIDDGRVALAGAFAGTFEGLRPLTGDLGASGTVSGPASVVVDKHGVVVQLDRGAMDAHVRGIPVTGLSGTVAVDADKRLRIVAAEASVAGGRGVAVEDGRGTVAFSGTGIDASRLALGATLGAGRIDGFGTAYVPQRAGERPRLDAGFALLDGVALGYPLDARASIGVVGDRLTIGRGFAVVAGTEASFDGAVGAIGGTPTYDLNAGVRGGDLGIVRENVAAMRGLRALDGSLDANVRVTGRGRDPRIVGGIAIPEGSYNGLAFHDARAELDAAIGAVSVRTGSIRVGSTVATFSGGRVGDRLSATVRSPKADLADFNDYFDIADTLGGVGRIGFSYDGTPKRISSSADIALHDVRYERFALGDARLAWHDANAAGNRIVGALSTVGASGSLDASGTLALGTGGPMRALRSAGVDLKTALRGLDLAVWLPAAGLRYPVTGRLDANAAIVGRFPEVAVNSDVHVRDGLVAGVPLQRADLAARTVNGRTLVTEAAIDVPNGTLRGTGSFGFARTSPLDLTLTASAPEIGTFLAQTLHRPYDVAGALETNVRVGGTIANPAIAAGFDLVNPRIERFAATRAFGSLALVGTNVKLVDAEIQLAKGTLSLSGEVPLQIAPTIAIGPSRAPVSFLVESRGVDIAALSPIFGANTRLTGTLDGRFGVEGTVAVPRLLGDLQLTGGSYVSDLERQQLKNLSARLAFAGAQVRIDGIHADAGRGRIDGSGTALLPIVPGSGLAYDVALTEKSAQLDSPQYASGTVDGTLRLVRTASASVPTLRGDVALSNATIPVAAIYNQNPPPPDPNAAPPLDLNLDLTASAGKNVRIRNAFIDVGAAGAVSVGGTLAAAKLDGDFYATNGTFNILSRAFRVQAARVTFTPDAGLVPQVDLRALARVSTSRDSFDVTTIVTGPSTALSTTFETDRNYSRDEVLAYLSGASALGFNASQAAQLPGTLRGLPPVVNALTPPQLVRVPTSAFSLSEAGFDVLNTQLTQRFFGPAENFFARTLGLTSFGLNLDYTGGIGFSARKELRRNVYLVYGQTLTSPIRENLGFEARPDRDTTLRLTGFTQQGVATYVGSNTNLFGSQAYVRTTANLPIGGTAGFNLTLTRLYP